jgi:TolB-like protein/tetratricopeptide (TPR) repeat protein/predicted Ser/Thr protein kinase
MPNGTFAPYEVLDSIGSGGMGVVYRARDTRLRREVAVKVLRHDAPWQIEARDRLLREARAISALNHPNICTVHDIVERDGQAFIVMELIQGQSLTRRLTPGGLAPETVTRWGMQLADALEHAHQHGVVHRDLKPSNVVVTPDGHVKLVDFGIAARAPRAPTETTVLESREGRAAPTAGTPLYMAPEVIRGGLADARSDIWSLGVLLHESLSGERPFQGPTPEDVTTAILRDPPKELPHHVPPELAAVVRRCLSKEPATRYQRSGEVRAALEAIQPRTGRALRPRIAWIAATSAAIVLVAVAAAVLTGSGRSANWLAALRGDSRSPVAAAQIRGLAVLPLRNVGGDSSQDFFADGMTAALITELAKVDRLKVISQTSAMRYRSALDRSLPQIGQELGVDAIVEGSVLRAGDRVRITVNLVHAGSDRQLWADSYERPVQDVLGLQSDIARAVVSQVEERVGTPQTAPAARTAKVDPAAYELFLRGEISVAQATPVGVTRAVEYYEQAIAIDPQFAPAYAGLAGAQFAQEFWGNAEFMSNVSSVRQSVRKALELDPNLAEAHVMMARILLNYEWDFAGAESSLKRAIALSPGHPFAHETYCWVLLALGRRDEALGEARQAASLDPRSAYMVFTEGRVLHRVRRYRDAAARYKLALAIDPGFPNAYGALAQLYTGQGRFAEATEMVEKRDRLPSARPAPLLRAMIDARRDGKRPAPERLATLPLGARARLYIALGEYDKAFQALDRAIADKNLTGHQFTDPEFDPVRSDPRFARVLERLGLPVDRLVAWGTWPAVQ